MPSILFFLSNSQDATCDYLCKIIDKHDIDYVRLNTDFFAPDVNVEFDIDNNIALHISGRVIKVSDIKCVWNRRPEKIHAGNFGNNPFDEHYRDEWRHSLDAFFKQIPENKWINHPYNNANSLSKVEQIVRALKYGLKVPRTIVTQDERKFLSFREECSQKVVTKPLSHGYIHDESTVYNIYTSAVDAVENDFSYLSNCPTLFQEKIDKEFDVRISYIDGLYEAVSLKFLENGSQRLDIRRDNMEGVEYGKLELPNNVLTTLKKIVESYNLRFAAIDMALTPQGEWVFFEVNPNGQWAWMDILGVSSFHEKLIHCMVNN